MLLLLSLACSGPCEEGFARAADGNCYPLASAPQDALGGDDPETALTLETVADASDGLMRVRDVEFNPLRPGELWTANWDNAVVVLLDAGTDSQQALRFSGPEAAHWLARPSGIAFGDNGLFATSHESLGDGPGDPANAMGPSLWPSDLEAFDGGRPSHLDMVHDTPLSGGIAWEQDNEYWVHDGYHGCLTWYDFAEPHEPGGTDHADARVVRYLEGEFGFVAEVPSHLAFDETYPNLLYFADTENSRVTVLNITSGGDLESLGAVPGPPPPESSGQTPPHGSAGAGKWRVREADLWTLAGPAKGLVSPSGLEVHEGLIWVTDNATSTIWAFTPDGEVADFHVFEELPAGSLGGLSFSPDGEIYLADMLGERVLRVVAQDADPAAR